MNKILLFIFILSAGFIKAQHYSQGVPVDTVIYTGVYSFPGYSCPGMSYPDITLDPALYNYVDGLEFMILVDSISFGPPPQFSPIHPGDTILLNSATPVYSTPAYIGFYFKLKLVGIPTTAGQTFPCHLNYVQCACNCYHLMIQPSVTNTSVCTVDISSGIRETNTSPSFILYPNPVTNKLFVSGISQTTNIKLYNSFGMLVLEKVYNQDMSLDIGMLPEGIYTLVASSNSSESKTSKKIVITR